MTAKQRAYAHGILDGLTGSDAYRRANPDSRANSRTIAHKAHKLSNHPEIMAYIAQERAKTAKRAAWTREEMLQTLREIAETKEAPKSARTGAIAQASKMLGFDAPQKIEGEVKGALVITWAK